MTVFSIFVVLFAIDFHEVLSAKEQQLRFIPVAGIDHSTYYYEHPGASSVIKIDAAFSQQVRVRIVEHLNELPELSLHCIVAPLDPNHELISATLCFRKSIHSSDNCIDPQDRKLIFGNTVFDADGNRSSGYIFYSRLPVQKGFLDGFYSCKYRNTNGEITSNFVEIQDAYYYHQFMVTREVKPLRNLPTLTINDLPMSLECGMPNSVALPSWADATFPSPFTWSFCELDNLKNAQFECIRQIRKASIHVTDYFESSVSWNGNLTLYKRTSSAWKNMGLVCWSHLRPSSIFSTYFGGAHDEIQFLQYNDSVPFRGHSVIVHSPIHQKLNVRKGPQSGLRLTASYQANPKTTETRWSKDGGRIPPDFREYTDFMLTFPTVVNQKHSGTYILNVQHEYGEVSFEYIVSVVGPPEVIRTPPSLILVLEGKNVTFDCEMDSFQTGSMEINGLAVQSNPSDFITSLKDPFPYLKDVRIQPLRITGSTLFYSASNLYFTPGSKIGPTHTVSLIGSNDYGTARVSTVVRVLPRPIIVNAPINYNCTTACSNIQSHLFDCNFNLEPYEATYMLQTWEFNGIDISKMNRDYQHSKFLKLEGTKLELLPVRDPALAALFEDVKLTCRLRIFYPDVLNNPRATDLETSILDPKMKIYDSNEDLSLQPSLTARLHLQVDLEAVQATANISWITAVIIAIVIIIAIGVLTTCIVMRSRGETYMLDREERALGNDPEKELREKGVFQTYERAEEPPLRGSRCSLNDDSAEIGSDADGELDDYNLDPGKFNEEGSFIGEYASDKHRGNNSRLPTLDRNYHPQA